LARLTKQWQVLLFTAGISSIHRGLSRERGRLQLVTPRRRGTLSALSTTEQAPSSTMHSFVWCSAFLVHLELGEQMLNAEMEKERSLG